MEEYMLPCPMLQIFHIPCPGCGGQRAFLYLLNGHFGDAFFMYPAIYPLLILGGLILFNHISPFREYSTLVSVFSILSVAVILTNYSIELNAIFKIF